MLTALIEAQRSPDALGRTLASLVQGAIDGLVRDVLVHDPNGSHGIAEVADHAGAVLVNKGELRAAVAAGRGDWLVVVQAGARLMEGWGDVVRGHMLASDKPARFTDASAGWLLGGIGRAWPRPADRGLLLPRSEAWRLMQAGEDSAVWAKRVRPVRIAARIDRAR